MVDVQLMHSLLMAIPSGARLLLVGDVGDRDCGYPSSVQMDDGTIVTVYYAWSILGDPRMGVHGGALLYRPEEI